MKTLLLLRHAKSSWKEPGTEDHDRPLNKRGRRDAPRMGKLLVERDLLPDLILCSTALRARTTTEMVAEAAGYEGAVEFTSDLYHAGVKEYFDILRAVNDSHESVMLVGHNPSMENFLARLVGELLEMPTAALASLKLQVESWSDVDDGIDVTFADFWRPKELD